MSYRVLTVADAARVREVDASFPNKFNWSWVDREIEIDVKNECRKFKLSEFIKKVDVAGKALCTLCECLISYGGRGASALVEHCKSKKHVDKVKAKSTNYSLDYLMVSGSEQVIQASTSTAAGPQTEKTESGFKPMINMMDRVSNSESMVLGVVAEHSLPLTMAPVMIELAKALASDRKALGMLSMDRTTAGYKMTYGLGKVIQDDLILMLREDPFSLNIDEATGKNNKKVLAFLASHYNRKLGKMVVSHLVSVEVFKVNAASIFEHVEAVMENNKIPWENLVSILMDSCSVMRGSKNGVEAKIRERAPHLLDIDGDSCHHIHNCCKKFCKPFDYWIEGLFNDLHTDFKWSADLKEALSEICELIGIKFTVPERFVPHRWLSANDLSISTIRLLDVLKVFYFSFLRKEDKLTYTATLAAIYVDRKTSAEARTRIQAIQREMSLKQKGMTACGKTRKQNIISKVLFQGQKTELQLNFYVASLGLLKSYVMVFQSKETLVHQLHSEQISVFKQFLGNFIKSEFIVKKSPKQLRDMNLEKDNGQFLDEKDMFVGFKCTKIVKEFGRKDSIVQEFTNQAAAAYITCGQYMQNKLPLDNSVLMALTSVDPDLQGHSVAVREMNSMVGYFRYMLSEEENEQVNAEIRGFHVDDSLPPYDETVSIVDWWVKVRAGRKYAVLGKVVLAALTVFHGPQVESSFNTMKDIIDPGSSNINVSTYSAIQTVKYELKSQKKSAIELFKREDPRFDPVNIKICRSVRAAASVYKKLKKANLEQREARKLTLKLSNEKLQSKKSAKEQKLALEEKARTDHLARERKKSKKRALEQLVDIRRKKQKNV